MFELSENLDIKKEEFYGEDHAYDFVTNLSCPKCRAYVEVFHRKEGVDD